MVWKCKQCMVLLMAALFVLLLPWRTPAAEIELIGGWPSGPASAIAVRDSVVYLAHGGFISAYHTATFARLSQIALSGYIRSIACSGRYAYVAAMEAGLFILDIDNPRQIKLVTTVNDVSVLKAVVQDSWAYLATDGNGLRILDISTPSSPKVLADFKPERWVQDVAVEGHYAYLACNSAGLCVVDVQNPVAPARLLTYPGGYTVYHVAVSGGKVFMCGSDNVRVTDLTNINQPREITTLSGMVTSIVFQGSIAYLVNDSHANIELHDLNDAAIKRVGGCGGIYATAVAVQPGLAYVALGNSGFTTYNVSDPAKPAEYGKWKSDKTLEPPFMVGELMVFPVFGEGELRFYDVQDLLHPRLVTTAKLYTDAYFYNAPYLYYTDGAMLRVSDLSDIYHPVEKSHLSLTSKTSAMRRQGDTLFIYDTMSNEKGFALYSMADPQNPVKLATVATTTPVSVVGKKGPAVYLYARPDPSANESTLYCLDMTDPGAPKESAVMIPTPVVRSFGIHSQYGIAATSEDSVIIFDLSRPLQPKRLAAFYDEEYAFPVFEGNLAYSSGRMGVTVYDVSDMTRWRKLSQLHQVDYYTGSFYYPPYFIKPTLNGDVYLFKISSGTEAGRIGEVRCTAANDMIEVDQDHLYLMDDNATLHRLRKENSGISPDGTISFREHGTSRLSGLQISGNTGYVMEEYHGHLHEINLKSAGLDLVNTWYLGDFLIQGFSIVKPYAYIRAYKEFRIYDISQPSTARLLGTLPLDVVSYGARSRVLLKGSHAFVNESYAVRILDISSPESPNVVASFSDDNNIIDMVMTGNYLYLGGKSNSKKIRAVDISNPLTPVAAGVFNDAIYGTALAAEGSTLYVAGGWYGLNVLDYRDPAAPVRAARYYAGDLELIDVAVYKDRIYALDQYRGILTFSNGFYSSVADEATAQPLSPQLLPNYPNPFNASTTITFSLPHSVRVRLQVHNVRGQLVADLADRNYAAGSHSLIWQAEGLPSGLYLCTISAGAWKECRKLMLLR